MAVDEPHRNDAVLLGCVQEPPASSLSGSVVLERDPVEAGERIPYMRFVIDRQPTLAVGVDVGERAVGELRPFAGFELGHLPTIYAAPDVGGRGLLGRPGSGCGRPVGLDRDTLSDKPDISFDVTDLATEPMVQFRRWYEDAEAEGIHLVNAIALATADAAGTPAVRHVLLRGFDDRGFVFYTNYESRKARHLAENPRAAFALLWKDLDRQVCVTGAVERTTLEESEAYFATRPREARLGAWASGRARSWSRAPD